MGKIILVLAKDMNGAIGNGHELPWGEPNTADIGRFRKLTLGKTILVGRKTHQIILKKFGRLKDREETLVLTRNMDFASEGATILHSKDEVLQLAKTRDIYVIGGLEIYNEFQSHASLAFVTEFEDRFSADTYFEWYDESAWSIVGLPIFVPAGSLTRHPLVFKTLARQTPKG